MRRCWRASRSTAKSACCRPIEHGRGVLFFTGHFGYWEMQAIAQPLRVRPVSVLARPLDNPYLHEMLERIRTRTGNSVIYRQGAIRKVMRELAANRGVALLIDQHLHSAGRGVRGLLRSPGGDDVGARGAGAAHRRAGDSGVRAAAAAAVDTDSSTSARSRRRARIRPTPSVSSRSAAPTCSRCTCAAIRRCGCGCIGAGAIAIPALADGGRRRDEGDHCSRLRMTVDPAQVRRVLVLSPNWLGDAVMALPAIADVRRRFTAARLIVAARKSVADLFRLTPVVDRCRRPRMRRSRSPTLRGAASADDRDSAAEFVQVGVAGQTRRDRRAMGICRGLPRPDPDARHRQAETQRPSGGVLPASGPRAGHRDAGRSSRR